MPPRTAKVTPENAVRTLPASQMFAERGSTGLNEWGGYIYEEFQKDLRGIQGYEKFREMMLSSAIVGGVVFALEQVLLSLRWSVEKGEGPDGVKAAEFVEENFHDMAYTLRDTVSELLSFLWYGWCTMEIVLKERKGDDPSGTDDEGLPLPSSKYDDGKIGWHKFSVRGQETLDHWELSKHNDLLGMWQANPKTGEKIFIGRNKMLHFKTTSGQRNPEGRSVLRTAYRAYHFLRRIEEIEAIGIERNATGLPVITPPESVDIWANTADMKQKLDYAKRVVTGVRRDALMGIVKPYGWTFELTRAPGSDPIDTRKVIDGYKWDIARCVLAQFLEQGRQQVGSFAAKVSDVQLFLLAIKGWVTHVSTEIQSRAVVPLVMIYNSFNLKKPPTVKVEDPTEKTIEELAAALKDLTPGGWVTPYRDGELFILRKAGMPEPPPEEAPEPTPANLQPPAQPNPQDGLPASTDQSQPGQKTPPNPVATGAVPAGRSVASNALTATAKRSLGDVL